MDCFGTHLVLIHSVSLPNQVHTDSCSHAAVQYTLHEDRAVERSDPSQRGTEGHECLADRGTGTH